MMDSGRRDLDSRAKRAVCEDLERRMLLSGAAALAPADPLPPVEPGELHFFTDPSLTTPGLVGSYIDKNLQGDAGQADWRATQTIAGTRTDPNLNFLNNNWGVRSQVGLMHGSDRVWQNFSVQWDGYVQIVSPHTGLTLGSDNGSRMWIDINHDGSFDATAPEYTNDAWGTVPNFVQKASSPLLDPGVYKVRVQDAVDSTGNAFEVTPHAGPTVRVAYLIPSNRTAQPGAVQALQQAVVWMQKFYRDQMERYGFGPLTFDYETQADGVTPQVWTVHVNDTDANMRADLFNRTMGDAFGAGVPVGTPGQDWMVIPETHVESSTGAITGSTSLGESLGSGLGGGEALTASDLLPFLSDASLTDDRPWAGMSIPAIGKFRLVSGVSYPDFNGSTISSLSSVIHGAFIHELTHGFGLAHDQINDDNFHGNLMYNGFRGFRGWAYPSRYSSDDMTLGYVEALALSTSDYFNPRRPVQDSIQPSISSMATGTVPLSGGLLPVHFSAADKFGLSAVLLLKNGDIIGGMPLSGTSFDGTITTPYFTKGHSDTYGLIVYDQAGNRQERDATITPKNGSDAAPQPFVRLLRNSTVGINQLVVLDASRSTDPDDAIAKVEWDLGDGNFVASPAFSMSVNFAQAGTHLIRARVTDAHGNQSISTPIALRVVASPTVSSFTVNDGSAQRSMVSSVTVTFDQPVTAARGSFQLSRHDNGQLLPISVSNPSGDGKTFVVTFTGQDLIGSSLPDGVYDLTLSGGGITAQGLFAQPLSGIKVLHFYRLFGDANGDGVVDAADVALLRLSYGKSAGDPGYLSFFDFNGDGRVDVTDLRALRGRLGMRLSLPALSAQARKNH